MSGRSAFVRAKNTQRADRKSSKEYPDYGEEDYYPYGYARTPVSTSGPTYSNNSSYISSGRTRRRQSVSSAGSTYGYPQPMRKPRPIIVASAIEKSDFRTHLDGMSSTLRGKLGKLLSRGDHDSDTKKRRPGTATVVSDSESRSTGWTPSLNAVPSLSPSTSPSEVPYAYPSVRTPTSAASRHKQQQESVIHKIRRFEGGGKLPQLGWKSLSNNPELWDEQGDTFVYMYMRGSRTKPPPSFRVNSKVIKESGSPLFIDQLFNPAEPEGWPRFYPHTESDRSSSPDDSIAPYESNLNGHGLSGMRSEVGDGDSLRPLNVSKRFMERAPRGIQHELYVAWPGAETGIHSTIWHITTRNFFAVMYDASALVGTTLHEAMTKLFERVTMYPDYLDRNISKVAWVTDYITRHKFDDVRNNPSYAASLLAFSEAPGVRWREGYIEAFVHCTGMLDMGLQTIPEWRHITPHTKMFLQNANMEIEERIHRTQLWLATFDFTEMWPTSTAPPSVQRGCFDRLRKWLCKYYEQAFLHWPPNNDQTWLTRDIVLRLRNDFYGLYDYLVDRDIIFDGSEYRPGQKWTITSSSGQSFRADTPDLPGFTDILLAFDNRHHFPHIPHPYPILPPSAPPSIHQKHKSAFTLKKPTNPADLLAHSRRKALTYSEASNVYTLRDQYMHTDLVTNFIRFEQSDMVDSLDPYEARRGRWLLIYGVLQVLATISVDSPNLRYKEGAQYHLSPQMKGVVPWADRGAPPEEEAEHTRSHCWVAPSTWTPVAPKARVGAHKPILWGQYGDGRVRGETPSPEKENSRERVPQLKYRNQEREREREPAQQQREVSISHKRAAEWVATNGGHQTSASRGTNGAIGELGSETGTTTNETDMGNSNTGLESSVGGNGGRTGSGSRTGMTPSQGGSSGGYSSEESAMAARRRRAMIHGFTDFQVPSDW